MNSRSREPVPELVDLQNVSHVTGEITIVEAGFGGIESFHRAYFLHSVSPDAVRGSHAHRRLKQVLIAVSGSFDVKTETMHGTELFHLASPNQGLLLKPYTWRTLSNFTPGAICLVLASHVYDESDYIRNYAQFREEAGSLS